MVFHSVDGQKSGVHQLRLVVYPIIYWVLAPSQVVVWDFFHQQFQVQNTILRKKGVHFQQDLWRTV